MSYISGISHNDIKSTNIMVDDYDNVYLIDFRLSEFSDIETSNDYRDLFYNISTMGDDNIILDGNIYEL